MRIFGWMRRHKVLTAFAVLLVASPLWFPRAWHAFLDNVITPNIFPFVDMPVHYRTSTEIVRLKIADIRFEIPRNYINGGLPRDWRGREVETDGFFLKVLLPELTPYTEQNAHHFRKPGWGNKVSVFINRTDHFIGMERVYEIAKKDCFGGVVKDLPEDKVIIFGNNRVMARDYIVKMKGKNLDMFFKCYKIIKAPSPECAYDSYIFRGIEIKIRMSRSYTDTMISRTVDVLCMVSGFVVNGRIERAGECKSPHLVPKSQL